MRSYGQYCPLAKAAEILGDRWTVLIVRELIMGSCRFNDIERGLPRVSRTLLSERLRALVRTGVVERRVGDTARSTSYHLSAAGVALTPVIVAIGEWGARWAFGAPEDDELDPVLLLWSMRGRVDPDAIPEGRTVIRFDFSSPVTQPYWLVVEPGDVSVCLQDPGFEADLLVAADLSTFYEIWYGRLDLARAKRDGQIVLQGPRALQRSFPAWFTLSPLADAVRKAYAEQRSSG
jgi:DNA-binding HxlR family transcriptional regulator